MKRKGYIRFPALVVVLILISTFVYLFKNGLKPNYSAEIINSRLKDKVIYSKVLSNTPNDKNAGIWESNIKAGTEKQVVSFEDLVAPSADKTKILDTYSYSPEVSPDKTKLAYYIGRNSRDQKNKTYALWIYDIISGQNKKMLDGVRLYDGYIQSPVWNSKSDLLYIVLLDDSNKNRLYSINLWGNRRLLGTNYQGDILWPQLVDGNLIAFNTALPDTMEVGVLNLRTNQAFVVNTPTSSYFLHVSPLGENAFLKNVTLGPSSVGVTDKNFISGLEKIDVNLKRAIPVSLPKSTLISPSVKRITPIKTCNNKWVILGAVQDDHRNFEEISQYYIFNIDDGSFKKINIPDPLSVNYFSFACDEENKEAAHWIGNLKVYSFIFSRPENVDVVDLENVFPVDLSKSCLYPDYTFPNNIYDAKSLFVNLRIGQACSSINEPDQGLYKIDLSSKTVVRVSKDKKSDETDSVLTSE